MKNGKLLLPLLCGTLFAGTLQAGTLIYRGSDRQERTISQVTIMAIDGKLVTIKVNNGTETIPISSIVKYYDTDIKGGGSAFEDDSAEYTVTLGSEKCPKSGYETSKKKNTVTYFSIPYDVTRKPGEDQKRALREPYFYLFVLTAGRDGDRNMFSYSYPARGKVSMKDSYDEAKMLEKVVSLDRRLFHPDDRRRLGTPTRSGNLGGSDEAKFKLDGIKDQQIIAWYLVVWGKNKIVTSKEWKDTGYTIRKNWWVR